MRPMYAIPSTAPKPSPCPPSQKEKPSMDPVEVFCRIRPSMGATPLPYDNNIAVCIVPVDEKSVELIPPPDAGDFVKTQICTFTSVFDEAASQQQVFDRVASDLVADLVQGKNGLLLTYGVTGSGKTYTMTGYPQNIGILPRCLDVVFNSIGRFLVPRKVFKSDTKSNTFTVQSEADAQYEVQMESMRQAKGTQKFLAGPPSEYERCERKIETAVVRGVEEDNGYAVFVSYFQVYNNYIYDLLDPEYAKSAQYPKSVLPPSKILREDLERKMFVSGVTEVEVRGTDEAFDVFWKGHGARRTAQTVLNTESSRSHAVFNIRLIQAPLDSSGRKILQDPRKIHVSQLSLVDLAGSERGYRTEHVGERIREAGSINESLMTLRQCIEQLRENQKTGVNKLVPYRNSRLTHFFKNYFDGEGKVRMVVCVNPCSADYDENKHVMDFAELTKEVEVPRAGGFRFPDVLGEPCLTPGRRRALAIPELEFPVERRLAMETGASAFPAVGAVMPRINLDSLTSTSMEWSAQMRSHFEAEHQRRQEVAAIGAQKGTEFEESLRKYVTEHKDLKRRYELQAVESSKCKEENVRLRAENQKLQSRKMELEAKLAEFERDAKYKEERGRHLMERERDMENQVRQKDMKLQAVKEIVRAPISFPRISPRAQASVTPITHQITDNKAATISSLRLHSVIDKASVYPKLAIPVYSPIENFPARPRRSVVSSRGQILSTAPAGILTLDRSNVTRRRRSKSIGDSRGGLFTPKPLSSSTSDDESDVVAPVYQKRKSDDMNTGVLDGPSTSAYVRPIGILKKSKY